VAPDLGWVAHLVGRLQSLILQSCGTGFGLDGPLTRYAAFY